MLPDALQMVSLVMHPIIFGFFHSRVVLLPHPHCVIQYFSDFLLILSAASSCFKTDLITGLLAASLIEAKGDELMGLKMDGLLFHSMEATTLM